MTTSNSGGPLPYMGRRHSIYGTEDRVVLDIGSLYMRCGYSGEAQPRHLIPVFGDLDCHRGYNCNESCRLTSRVSAKRHTTAVARPTDTTMTVL